MKKIICPLLLISIVFLAVAVNDCATAAGLTLEKAARNIAESYFKDGKPDLLPQQLIKGYPAKVDGLFVTIFNQSGKSRGCWGRIYSGESLADSLKWSVIGALKNDYRYKPIRFSELDRLKFQVSLIIKVVPVSNTRSVNPFTDGLMVKSGGKNGVILAGEAVDSYHQMIMAKLKAGIPVKQKCSLYKLVLKTYKE